MKKNIAFLFDKKNFWIEDYLNFFNFKKYSKKYSIKCFKDEKNVKNFDVVFVISYTKILSTKFIKKNRLSLIPHPSELPKDKGFAPIHNAVLKKKKKFFISLIKAEKEVDSGDICIQRSYKLNGDELMDDLRFLQAKAIFHVIGKFLDTYPKIRFRKQKGRSNFNKRRNPSDSQINIKKSILSQFNLLRVCDNKRYPAFFIHKGVKYFLKIEK